MRALLIDSADRAVREVEYNGNFEQINKFIGSRCFTCVRLTETETLYVDDEGLLRNDLIAQPFFAIEGYPEPLVGNGLILGNNMGGESTPTKLDVDTVFDSIKFLTCLEAYDYSLKNGVEE